MYQTFADHSRKLINAALTFEKEVKVHRLSFSDMHFVNAL